MRRNDEIGYMFFTKLVKCVLILGYNEKIYIGKFTPELVFKSISRQ